MPASEYLCEFGVHGYTNLVQNSNILDLTSLIVDSDCIYAAYTTDELLAWLALKIFQKEKNPFRYNYLKLVSDFTQNGELVWIAQTNLYIATSTIDPLYTALISDTPSNALAKLAIYLLDNDLIK